MPSNHPLPSVPGGGPPRPYNHDRTQSTFSFKSNRSRRSSGSGAKVNLSESHDEKESRRLHSKADPSVAIMEAEPATVAASVQSSMAPLRAMQHKDATGNPIADPDRSNPTRSRWERPLDTIRSFEAAIDGNYRRSSYYRADSSEPAQQNNWNPRNSYYAGTNGNNQRSSVNGYYGGRSQSYGYNNREGGRPDSYYPDNNNNQDYNGNGGPSNIPYPNRSRYPRTQSDPPFTNGPGVYPMTGNQQSYETVTSGSLGEPAGYTTDPSSENSSVDRVQPLQNRVPADNYGLNGFGASPQLQPVGAGINTNSYNKQNSTVLRKDAPGGRGPISLGNTANGNGTTTSEARRPEPEKRKSFFKRFSKSS